MREGAADGYAWEEQLPQLIDAIFYPIHGVVDHSEGGAEQARRLHDTFIAQYGLGRDEFMPLLTFDLAAATSKPARPPFQYA